MPFIRNWAVKQKSQTVAVWIKKAKEKDRAIV